MDRLFEDINPFAIAAEGLRFGLLHLDQKVDELRDESKASFPAYGAKLQLRRARRDRHETRLALAAVEQMASFPVTAFTDEDDKGAFISVFPGIDADPESFCDVDDRSGEREIHLSRAFRKRVVYIPYGRCMAQPLTRSEAIQSGLSLLVAGLVASPTQPSTSEEVERG